MTGRLERMHRERKRKKEMEIAMGRLRPYLRRERRNRILEFGSGDGYQIPFLREFGDIVASDIRQDVAHAGRFRDMDFIVCDIRNAPFDSGNFDLVFANHVIEHIDGARQAFAELKRIGKGDCVYAFAVPTDIWLWVSLPAQFYNGVRKLFGRKPRGKKGGDGRTGGPAIRGWRSFFPRGHGWRKGFFDCLDSFRIKSWHSLFTQNGFEIMEVAPLLLYSASEFPVMPTTRFLAERGVCSSVMFIMRKK